MKSESKRSFPLKAIMILASVFVFGMITGAATLTLVVKNSLQRVVLSETPVPPVKRALDRIEKSLARELDLDTGEQARIRAELEQTADTLFVLRRESFAGFRQEIRGTIQRIEETLPPEKHERLNEIARDRFAPWGIY